MPLNEKPITFKEVIVTVTSESGQGLQDLTPSKNISIEPSKTLSDLLKKVGNVPEDYPVVAIVLDGERKEKPNEKDKLSKLLQDLKLDDKNEFKMLAICVAGEFKDANGANSYKYRK